MSTTDDDTEPPGDADGLSHLDPHGKARMVEVGEKDETRRLAVATGIVRVGDKTLRALIEGRTPKGDVFAIARVAGIQAAKRTAELIPLCHAIGLTGCDVQVEPEPPDGVRIEARVRARDRTGVEMEALTAVSVAALTIYDMLKAIDREMVIEGVMLLEKHGGRRGTYRRGR